jgi:hypothetical protein
MVESLILGRLVNNQKGFFPFRRRKYENARIGPTVSWPAIQGLVPRRENRQHPAMERGDGCPCFDKPNEP